MRGAFPRKKRTIIGTASSASRRQYYLRRDGCHTTTVDMRPPGDYCSFANAGISSPGPCGDLPRAYLKWIVPRRKWGRHVKSGHRPRLSPVLRSASGLNPTLLPAVPAIVQSRQSHGLDPVRPVFCKGRRRTHYQAVFCKVNGTPPGSPCWAAIFESP